MKLTLKSLAMFFALYRWGEPLMPNSRATNLSGWPSSGRPPKNYNAVREQVIKQAQALKPASAVKR